MQKFNQIWRSIPGVYELRIIPSSWQKRSKSRSPQGWRLIQPFSGWSWARDHQIFWPCSWRAITTCGKCASCFLCCHSDMVITGVSEGIYLIGCLIMQVITNCLGDCLVCWWSVKKVFVQAEVVVAVTKYGLLYPLTYITLAFGVAPSHPSCNQCRACTSHNQAYITLLWNSAHHENMMDRVR